MNYLRLGLHHTRLFVWLMFGLDLAFWVALLAGAPLTWLLAGWALAVVAVLLLIPHLKP